jgi:branched-chain amino acid transport system substrate-binding protein
MKIPVTASSQGNVMKFANLISFAAALVVGLGSTGAQAQQPIKIGDINSYSAQALVTEPYRKGALLAVEEVNAAGGALGRKLEVIFRDDAMKPGEAIKQAEELVANEKISVLAGGFSSSVCLAIADLVVRKKIPFVCSISASDAIVWEKGNAFTFRTNTSTYMLSEMLADAAAKLPAKRWATIAPNYEFGTSFVAAFKERLKARRPDVEWVAEQWPAIGKLDPGPTIDALNAAKPDAIFNATFGTDLIRFVREGNTREFFKGRVVASGLTGNPEFLDPLKEETPEGWIVTGYAWDSYDTPEHSKFRAAYEAKYRDYPRWYSVVGYVTYKAIAAAIAKAGSTDGEAIRKALEGLTVATPLGPVQFRAGDHQANIPSFVGKTTNRDGKGAFVEWRFVPGDAMLPSETEAAKLRPTTN